MGLLSEGATLSWEETKKRAEEVRARGVDQLINLYHRESSRSGDPHLWGDEVEYSIVKFTDGKVRLSLKSEEVLSKLEDDLNAAWKPENGAYMVEGTPGVPFTDDLNLLPLVEENMKKRRTMIQNVLDKDEFPVTMSIFPRLGCHPFTYPEYSPEPRDSDSRSIFWPDEATYQGHPRFKMYMRHTRMRRGEKVVINAPLYIDSKTDPDSLLLDWVPSKVIRESELDGGEGVKNAKAGHIYMDSLGFGMGLSCLQVTFQTADMSEAEFLYDQLTPLCPLFLALTASSPIFRGYLSDLDCRWHVISAAMDDRTEKERNEGKIKKSRYASVSTYISSLSDNHGYNDIPLPCHQDCYDKMIKAGMKKNLARHFSHLFIRDGIVLPEGLLNQDDEKETGLFETIQSSNWQTMRFKPPPNVGSSIGWRVEFRPCELHFTDFENAAVAVFIKILTKIILERRCNFMLPISQVDENMRRAQLRDAVTKQKFLFRTNIGDLQEPPEVEELTLDEIFNGTSRQEEGNFGGLIPLAQQFLENDPNLSDATRATLLKYFELLRQRSNGESETNALRMREFVINHPGYQKDSKVTEQIAKDLMENIVCNQIFTASIAV